MRKREDQKVSSFPRLLTTCALLACALGACMSEGAEPAGAQVYYFSAFERDAYTPTVIKDPGTPISEEELAQLKPIFESFEANSERLFQQPDITQRIATIESAYLRAGRYLDLLKEYRADIKRQGIAKSPASTRLLWGLIRLGQESQSKRFARELLQARPKSADAWFLYGAFWIKYAAEDDEAAKRVVFGWSKTVEFDPQYKGFEGIDAGTMRREIARLRQESGVTQKELTQMELDLLGTPPSPDEAAGTLSADGVITQAKSLTQPAVAVTPPAEPPVEPPAANAPDAPAKTPPPVAEAPAQAERTPEQSLLLAMARVKVNQANKPEAVAELKRSLVLYVPEGKIERATEVLNSDTSLFSLVRLSWSLDHELNATARLFRKVAARPTSNSMALYKRAMFALNDLEDRALGENLLTQLKKQDADFAARYKVDELLKD